MTELVGVYSFPKSGNTWLRAILACVMARGQPLPASEPYRCVPDLHKHPLSAATEFNGHRFFKHHAGRNLKQWKGKALNTTRVIHIRRHPLDVFLSYLNFISDNVTGTAPIRFASAEAIHGTQLFEMYFHSFITMGHVAPKMVTQSGSWFSHNHYWLTQQDVPVTFLRYEDLLADPGTTLGFLCNWLDLSPDELDAALDAASQATLPNGRFFWRRGTGHHTDWFGPKQIALFLKHRGADCAELGYPPEDFGTSTHVTS